VSEVVRTDARVSLLRALSDGVSGALLGYAPDGTRCTVYVTEGEILAAHADDDDAAVVRRLVITGKLSAAQGVEIEEQVAQGGTSAQLLYQWVSEEILGELYAERFRENVYRFLGGAGGVAFEPMDAVFVDNIQVGHVSVDLVGELFALRTSLAALEAAPDRVVQPGAGGVSSPAEVEILLRCPHRLTVGALVAASPFEASHTLQLLQRMLDTGAIEADGPARKAPAPPSVPQVPDPAPEPIGRWMPVPAHSELDVGGDLLSDADLEEHTEEVDRSAFNQSPGVSPSQLLAPSEDEDLAAFADYDQHRVGGHFSQSRRNLDRVVLTPEAPAAPARGVEPSELVEMEEADQGELASGRAVSLNFTGRKLAEAEARKKVDVLSEVLATVVEALDRRLGTGAGFARVQVLVEGTSGPHAVLFSQVELLPDGSVPVDRVIRNLRKRPEGERRPLLNRALADVIERALSLADEVLDQQGMETMLERIAGYQKRLGV